MDNVPNKLMVRAVINAALSKAVILFILLLKEAVRGDGASLRRLRSAGAPAALKHHQRNERKSVSHHHQPGRYHHKGDS